MKNDKQDTPITHVSAVQWEGSPETGRLRLLDQRQLPHEERWVTLTSSQDVADAIRDMIVRGAPAIGLAAAYGVVLAAQEQTKPLTADGLDHALTQLLASRPTAVNLQWAIDRLRTNVLQPSNPTVHALWQEADNIRTEDEAANAAMGAFGAALLPNNARILTHCNTGALATSGIGTALGVIRTAHAQQKLQHVYATETRPYLQGARLTMWELIKENIPATLITDSMASWLMQEGKVDAIFVGADRIAANGDTANKIGTYGLAISAAYHNIPFYVVAPTSTIDPRAPNKNAIPIEMRSAEEVVTLGGVRTAPQGIDALHPAFDVTPAELISAIVTDKQAFQAPYSFG